MRSSDWSSDVCSSDLRTLVPGYVVVDSVLGRPRADREGGMQLPRHAGSQGDPVDLGSELAGTGFDELLREVLLRVHGVLDDRARWRLLLDAVVTMAADLSLDDLLTRIVEIASRSEEHTSELQSLMRISYAVFCLKKKRKQ